MPASTEERRNRWGVDERAAIEYLEGRGFILRRDYSWFVPNGTTVTEMDSDAVAFLVEEWDFGGMRFSATS